MMNSPESSNIIEITRLKNVFSGQVIHENLDLTVKKGEILAVIGGSGSGKTTLFRCILMLLRPTSGKIKVFNQDIEFITEQEAQVLRRRWGMLFQHSALFSSMTVLENIMFPMKEFTHLNSRFIRELAMLKLNLTGLPNEAATKFPSELSGGMQRRAATSRAIAMDPELLFLDEPTSGLDPVGARQFDELVVFLRDTLKLTIIMISHDIESLKQCSDRIAFIGEGRIIALEPFEQLIKNPHPLIVDYFKNFRVKMVT